MGYSSFSDFVTHLLEKKDADEITMILNKLTTNYTFFMREQEHLEYFRQRIIPDLIRRHQRDKVLSIWSAGCSSGEEPYNITMYLFDYLGTQARGRRKSPVSSVSTRSTPWSRLRCCQ